MKEILSKIGYKGINAFTPGKLDVDILFKNRKLIKDDYWMSLMDYLNKNELEELQVEILKDVSEAEQKKKLKGKANPEKKLTPQGKRWVKAASEDMAERTKSK